MRLPTAEKQARFRAKRAATIAALHAEIATLREAQTMTTLYEVITTDKAGRAYGITFSDPATARAYTAIMAANGYDVDPSPPFNAETSLSYALKDAANFYEDSALSDRAAAS